MFSNKKFNLSLIILISITIIIFNPIIFSESQKSWHALEIFNEDFSFLNLTYGPLYLIYLKIISIFFSFPSNIKIELIITSSIFIYFAYNFINIFFKNIYTIIISIPLIPLILLIESRQNLLAAAFALVYFKNVFTENKNELIPLSLIFSICISRTFLPLIAIHIIYHIFTNIFYKKKFQNENKKIIKSFLILFFLFSLINQSVSKFNNHMLYDSSFAPNINLNNPLEIGFFQFSNQAINDKKNKSKEDWFVTFNENFSGNNTILKVLYNKPEILFQHVINNIPKLLLDTSRKNYGYIDFYFNNLIKIIFLLFFIVLSLIGLIHIFKKYNIKNLIPSILYAFVFFLSLLITNPTSRYLSLIMPLTIIPFYISLHLIFKKKLIYFLIIFTIVSGYFNFKFYLNHTTKSHIDTTSMQKFLIGIEDMQNIILTNEKNLLIAINNKNKKYIGFDSLPPYFDEKIFNEISKVDYIIFTDYAKNYDDISTKQGQKYYTYIEPNIEDNYQIKRLGDFSLVEK